MRLPPRCLWPGCRAAHRAPNAVSSYGLPSLTSLRPAALRPAACHRRRPGRPSPRHVLVKRLAGTAEVSRAKVQIRPVTIRPRPFTRAGAHHARSSLRSCIVHSRIGSRAKVDKAVIRRQGYDYWYLLPRPTSSDYVDKVHFHEECGLLLCSHFVLYCGRAEAAKKPLNVDLGSAVMASFPVPCACLMFRLNVKGGKR